MLSSYSLWTLLSTFLGRPAIKRRRGRLVQTAFAAEFPGCRRAYDQPCLHAGDQLEQRIMLTASAATESDFMFVGGAITGYAGVGSDVVVPATIGGQQVTAIAATAFQGRTSLTGITLPTGLSSIGASAFAGCTALASITFPTTLTYIAAGAFKGCSGLTSIALPTSLSRLENSAFADCTGLSIIFFLGDAPSVSADTFAGVNARVLYLTGASGWNATTTFGGLTAERIDAISGASGGFQWLAGHGQIQITGCTGTDSRVTIPATIAGLPVTSIGNYAFSTCSHITAISIPSSVTSIGLAAFYGCSSLTQIALPAGLTRLGPAAFQACSSLRSVALPAGVTSINPQTFYNCSSLISISLPAGVSSIEAAAFLGCSSLESIVLPATVTSLDDGAFMNCTGLKNVICLGPAPTLGVDVFRNDTATILYVAGSAGWSTPFGGIVARSIAPPTDLLLSGSSIKEQSPGGSEIGVLSAASTGTSGLFTYTLVPGAGSTDNALFTIVGDRLRSAAILDSSSTPSCTIRVRTTDLLGGFIEKALTVTVTPVNRPPSAVTLSAVSASLPETTITAAPIKLANIVVADDAHGHNTLSLGGDDAGMFEILGSSLYLKAGTRLDHETSPHLSATVNATDTAISGSPTVSTSYQLAIINEAPAVSAAVADARSYRAGDAVVVNVSFSEPVMVTGQPLLGLTVGTALRQAGYTGGSGTHTLQFRYVVAAGENDADGVAADGAISLPAGGSIRDGAGADALLALPSHALPGLVIDNLAPSLTTTTGPAAGTYGSGQKLFFTVNFNEPMVVRGLPLISLKLDKGVRQAVYASGAGTRAIVFAYTIAPGETAAAKKVVLSNAIQLPPGAAITDRAGNLAPTLSLSPPASTAAVKVDGVLPVVKSLVAPAAKTYKAGETLVFKATFTKPVYVIGVPDITVSIGSQTRQARISSGSGTATLSFSYTVATGDLAAAGVGVATRINLRDGLIRDSVENPASTNLPAAKTGKVFVDAVGPSVVALSAPAPGTYRAGQKISFTTRYNEAVVVSGKPRLQAVIGLAVRDLVYAKGSGTNQITYSYKIQPGDLDADGIVLKPLIALAGGAIRDKPGNTAAQLPLPESTTKNVVVR
jgi:hypothetical protein